MRRSKTGPKTWTTSTELMVELDARPEATKSGRLRGALRDAIGDGRLGPGTRLPSTRALAADLGLSRGLVVETYEQLVAEGYLASAHGSGTTVADNTSVRDEAAPRPPRTRPWLVDFEPGTPDLAAFPRSAWTSAVRAALREIPDADLSYRDARGDERLRTELSAYLRRVRGARTDPARLFIVTGFTHGLSLVARALAAAGVVDVGVEDPGAYAQREAVEHAGLRITPIASDADGGARTDLLDALSVGAVMVTPAHHYPLGGVLAAPRRTRLLEWARERPDRWIVEDDYDAEFRYDRSPVGTLHGLAPEQVVLGGSVSKSMAPAMRLGWIAVPSRLAPTIEESQRIDHALPSTIDQRALALLLASGRYDRHIRRSRSSYRTKRDVLLAAIAEVPGVDVGGVAAGLHMSVTLPDRVSEDTVTRDLASRGVNVQGLAPYRIQPGPPGLVLGYAHLSPDALHTGGAIVAETLRRHV